MAHELQLQLRAAEGAMLRVLGTIERRGYTLGALVSTPHAQGLALCLQLEPNGRQVEVLLRQLRKVYDVLDARFGQAPREFALPAHATRSLRASRRIVPRTGAVSVSGVPT